MSQGTDEQTAILKEILKWIRFTAAKEVKAVLIDVMNTEQKSLIYHLSDGNRSSAEIGKSAGISDMTVRRLWASWARLGIVEAIKNVIGWVANLANKLINLVIPGWLTPGSPTPFEIGLRGISSALREAANLALPEFQSQLSFSGINPTTNKSINNQNDSNGKIINIEVNLTPAAFSFADEKEIARKLAPVLRSELRNMGVA